MVCGSAFTSRQGQGAWPWDGVVSHHTITHQQSQSGTEAKKTCVAEIVHNRKKFYKNREHDKECVTGEKIPPYTHGGLIGFRFELRQSPG